jgi:hypothetical protein
MGDVGHGDRDAPGNHRPLSSTRLIRIGQFDGIVEDFPDIRQARVKW